MREWLNITAADYLSEFHYGGGTFFEAVQRDPANAVEALIGGKIDVRDRVLAPGELPRVIDILRAQYPEAVEAWVRKHVQSLSAAQAMNLNREAMRTEGINRFHEEERVLFEMFPDLLEPLGNIIDYY